MLVATSFKYSSPPMDRFDEKTERRSTRRNSSADARRKSLFTDITSPTRTPTEPVTIPSPKTAHAVQPRRTQQSVEARAMPPCRSATVGSRRRKSPAHDPDALSPSVAALLAVTAIPPRRVNRCRARSGADRNISIEQLVSEWKSDESLKSSYGTSPALSALLEDTDDGEEQTSRTNSDAGDIFLKTRSESSESVPSLDADDRSILSGCSPSTPESLRSRRSLSNLKKVRPVKTVEDCVLDHPLVSRSDSEDGDDDEEIFQLPTRKREAAQNKTRPSFTSNLTASLQNLKNAAISSITSLSRSQSPPHPHHHHHHPAAPPIDQMLWSHPFLFPGFSSEIRPATDASSTHNNYLVSESSLHSAQQPLTFEEQEAPFQQALHAPYLAESLTEYACAPRIQMQTYNRSGGRRGRSAHHSSRRGAHHGGSWDPKSEAGRALLGAAGARQREIRENGDFLRVVVLEMNMRREGKLESGRARIWLPPREEGGSCGLVGTGQWSRGAKVPSRWIGESAY